MAKKDARALCARQSFHVGRRFIPRGTVVRSDDPVIEGREHLFQDVNEELGIEQATAAPGERRNVSISADHVCDECGFEAKSASGLSAHQRSHEDD